MRIDDSNYFVDPPFMSNKPREKPDGNSLLYLGTRIVILNSLDLLVKEDIEQFIDAINRSWVRLGLLNRGGGKTDPEAHDDYIGVTAAANICMPYAARAIAKYGMDNDWEYENVPTNDIKKKWSYKFWRLAGVTQHIKVAAGIPLNLLDQLILSLDLVYSSFSPANETSGRILDWLKIKTLEGRGYILCDIAALIWKRSIKKKYEKQMGSVFSIYFSENHPFAIYMENRI